MLRTYKAVLRGDRVEWIDEPPPAERPVPIHVTLLEEDEAPSRSRGAAMREALEALAHAGGLSGIPDPDAWERDVRTEKPLPGRED